MRPIHFVALVFLSFPGLLLGDAPANDDFALAVVLAERLPIAIEGTNAGATLETDAGERSISIYGASVWYSWTPDQSMAVTIDTIDPTHSYSPALAVWTGNSIEDRDILELDLDSNESENPILLDAVAGTTYYIGVYGANGFGGAFTLNLSTPVRPENDDFAAAVVLSGTLPLTVSGSNADATLESAEPFSWPSALQSIWYTWTPASSGIYLIDTFGSSFDTVLAIWDGDSLETLTRLAVDDDAEDTLQSEIRVPLTGGIPYRIAVYSAGQFAGSGDVTLNFRKVDASLNDFFEHRTVLPGQTPQSISGSNVNASIEGLESNPVSAATGSVWFEWTPTISGVVQIDTFGSGFDTILAIQTGNEISSLSTVAVNDDTVYVRQSGLNFQATAGTTYQIAVAGYAGATGDFVLNIGEVHSHPPNDDFADSREITRSLPLLLYGSHGNATLQADLSEPLPFDSIRRSVWYQWTADFTGTVLVTTESSPEAHALAVWTGTDPGSLELVAASRDHPGEISGEFAEERWTLLQFDAVSGTTYKIAVYAADYSTDSGEFVLELTRPASISGTVTETDGVTPIEGIEVAMDMVRIGRGFVASGFPEAVSGSDGTYTFFPVLPRRRYGVFFNVGRGRAGNTWEDELQYRYLAGAYKDPSLPLELYPIVPGSGEAVTGIDGRLQKAGTVSGRVTGPDGSEPLAGVTVTVFTLSDDLVQVGSSLKTTTDEDGRFLIEALGLRTTWFHFENERTGGYVAEYYDNASSLEAAQPFEVTEGAVISGVNVSLERGPSATISGNVTDPGGEPATSVQATAYRRIVGNWVVTGSAETDENGDYRIENLGDGSYQVHFTNVDPFADVLYAEEIYGGFLRLEDNDNLGYVHTTAGAETTGIDASLDIAPANDPFAAAVVLPGTVSLSASGSNAGASMEIGEPVPVATAMRSVWYAWTPTASGTYSIDTFGSSFDTILTLWQGNTLETLQHLVGNDDVVGISLQSEAQGDFDAGVTYRIAVYGFDGASGDIMLNINPFNVPDEGFLDTDGDGLPGRFEQVLGLDANTPNANPVRAGIWTDPQSGNRYLTLTVDRNPDSDLQLAGESGPSPDQLSTATTLHVIDTADRFQVRDAEPLGSANQRFIRLIVPSSGN